MKRRSLTESFTTFRLARIAARRRTKATVHWRTLSVHSNIEMTLDPRKTNYLTPSQECVCAYLSKTTHWRTARDVALSVGIAEATAKPIIQELVRAGLVQKRLRNYGFDAGTPEFKGKRSDVIAAKRKRERWAQIVGVELFHVKLRRFLGVKRAREAERILNS